MTRYLARRTGQIACALILVAHAAPFAQSPTITLMGVAEPPELLGPPKTPKAVSDTERHFFDLLTGDWNDLKTAKDIRDQLTTFSQEHPDYADAYYMRAVLTRCLINSSNDVDVLSDLTRAIETHSSLGDRIATLGRYYVRASRQGAIRCWAVP